MLTRIDREILGDLYLSRAGLDFLEELVDRFGSRFGGTEQEHGAAAFIAERFRAAGADKVYMETFTCPGWTRKETRLQVTSPAERELDCIALPYCPPGEIEAPLVYLGDGDPQTYEDNRDRMKGAIVMVSTATPKYYHRAMHRGEKLGRALEAGAIGFIWMRGEPGGLPETGSARLGRYCEVPAISVAYETGHELLRLAKKGPVTLKITSTNQNHPVTSHNVVAEFTGRKRPDEVLVIGAHYDGHDISQSASDDGCGIAVVVEIARALGAHKQHLDRTVRLVGFAQEEMGLIGAETHAARHEQEQIAFMLNLDGAGRGNNGTFALQGWSEATAFFKSVFKEMHEADISVGDRPGLYSDMYPFAAKGIPSATFSSQAPASAGAPRGFGHTFWDSLDKVQPKPIQIDACRVARLALRLATLGEVPLRRKSPAEIGEKLKVMGLDTVLRYELRRIPGEE
jgi:aminopeptidase YwaD